MEAMKSELTCPICLQLYTSPVGLPCSHSACLGCVQSLVTKNFQRYDSAVVGPQGDVATENGTPNYYLLSCPVCNDTVNAKTNEDNVLSQLPTNKLLQNIVDRYRVALEQVGGVNGADSSTGSETQVHEDEKAPNCDMCEDEDEGPQVATKWCADCTVLYCDECFAQCHRMKGPLASHTIKSPPPSAARINQSCNDLSSSNRQKGLPSSGANSTDVLKCDIHDDEKINMYCIVCDQLICALCKLVGEHKEHEVNDLNTCYKLKQDTLARNCDKLIESSLSLAASMEKLKSAQHDFTESKVTTEEQLNECFDELERSLAKRKDVLFKQLSSHYNERLKDVDETSQAVKNNLDSVHSLLSFANEAMKETDQISFLQSSNSLCKRVLEACEQGAAMEKKCAAFELLENSGGRKRRN